jgi:hypothetical protein
MSVLILKPEWLNAILFEGKRRFSSFWKSSISLVAKPRMRGFYSVVVRA